DAQLELFVFVDLEALDQIHVESEAGRPRDPAFPEAAQLSGLRISQNKIPRFIAYCKVRTKRVQILQAGNSAASGVRTRNQPLKVSCARDVGGGHNLTRVLRKSADQIRCG